MDRFEKEVEKIKQSKDFFTRDHCAWTKHMIYAASHAKNEGLWLEFGVRWGVTITDISKLTDNIVYGFDSWKGLQERWNNHQIGMFSTGGKIPSVPTNVNLITGFFEDTLPDFIKEHNVPVAFMHIDCDLYSSTKCILKYLKDHIKSGTVIVFDEIWYYDDYKHGEMLAWFEYVDLYQTEYKWLCHSNSGGHAALIII